MIQEVSSGGIIAHKGLVFIIQNRFGEWGFPKGHIEDGETSEEAALREVAEESGLKASIIRRVGQTRYQFKSPLDGKERQKIVHWYLMKAESQTIVLGEEEGFLDGKFVSISDALKTLTHDNDRQLLEITSGFIKAYAIVS